MARTHRVRRPRRRPPRPNGKRFASSFACPFSFSIEPPTSARTACLEQSSSQTRHHLPREPFQLLRLEGQRIQDDPLHSSTGGYSAADPFDYLFRLAQQVMRAPVVWIHSRKPPEVGFGILQPLPPLKYVYEVRINPGG